MQRKISVMKQAAQAFSQRRYADARDIYAKAIESFGQDSDLIYGLAQVEFALSIVTTDVGDTGGHTAVRRMRQAIQLAPTRPEYYCALGDMLEHVGAPDYEAAAQAYRCAIELEPSYTPALARLAMLHGVPEDVVSLDEALHCCEKATRIAPTRSLWMVMARLYGYTGREADTQRAIINSLLERNEVVSPPY